MKKSILLVVFWICSWLTAIDGFAQSSEETSLLERILPENTLAVCVFPNLQNTIEGLTQTRFYELLRSEQDVVARDVATLTQEFEQNAGFPLATLGVIFHQSVAVALLDISSKATIDADILSPEVVLLADVGDAVDALQDLLETIVIKKIQSQEPSVEFLVESVDGRNLYVLTNSQFQLCYTFLENIFVLALQRETVQQIIAVSKQAVSNLSNVPTYRSAAHYMGKERQEARIYIDIRNIWLKLRPYFRQMCSSTLSEKYDLILDILDRSPLQSLMWTFFYQDRGIAERIFFEKKDLTFADDSSDVFPDFSGGDNILFTSDQLIPATVVYYSATKVDWPEIWRQLIASISMLPESPQENQFERWLKSIADASQFDLEKDLLATLGQEIAIFCDPSPASLTSWQPGSTVDGFPCLGALQVQEKEQLERLFQRVFAVLPIEYQQKRYQGIEIYTVTIPGKIAPISVHVAFVRNFLVIGASSALLGEVIRASQQRTVLASTQDYQRLSAYFPKERSAQGYINIKRLLRLINTTFQRTGKTQLNMMKGEEMAPLVSTFAEQLSGMMWVTTRVDGGFLAESFSPVGGTIIGMSILWLGWWIMLG